MINRKLTFDSIHNEFGSLKQNQVVGIDAFIDEYEKRELKDPRFLAYMLATAWHETRATMQPIEEDGRGKGKAYGSHYKEAKDKNGQRLPYTDTKNLFYGRGYVQLTWYENYKKATAKNLKGWDFMLNPGLMLQVEPAIWAAFEGMINGWFTGKRLSDYFNAKSAPVSARRIINGTDRAELIAGYYEKFKKSITHE